MSEDTAPVEDGPAADGPTEDDPAPIAADVLDVIVAALVDDADAVRVDAAARRDRVRLEVRVAPGEMGRVIGKRGRVAAAIRTVVRAAAVKDGVEVDVEFED